MRLHFAEVAMHEDGTYGDAKLFGMHPSETLPLFRYDGDLYFVNDGYLEKQLLKAVADKPKLKVAILDIRAVEQIDTTGEEMLAHMTEWFKEAGIEFYITRPKFKVTDVLKRQSALAAIQQKYGDLVDIEHLQLHLPVNNAEKELAKQ